MSKAKSDPRIIELDKELIEDCRLWCDRVRGTHPQWLHGRIDFRRDRTKNPFDAFFASKVAEVAAAVMLDADPSFDVNPKRFSDDGKDFTVYMNNRPFSVDVKSTCVPRGTYCVWPHYKSLSKMADILVFARAAPVGNPAFGKVFVPAFTMKETFVRMHKTATENNFLENGTPFMDYRDMTPIEILIAATRVCLHCGKPASFGIGGADVCLDHFAATAEGK